MFIFEKSHRLCSSKPVVQPEVAIFVSSDEAIRHQNFSNKFFLVSVFLRLLSDGPESESVGDVVDASLSGDVVDGVRSGDSGVGVAGLLLGGVDVAVAVVVVAELILKKSTSFS